MDMMLKGQVPAEDIVTHTFPLEQFDEAFHLVLSAKESIKVMLQPSAY
jgi:threonine dehydrogenase-like Zn-dependent dehydrogenase